MRLTNSTLQCDQITPAFVRKLPNIPRKYFFVENRSAVGVRMKPDSAPQLDGSDGIEIAAGAKYELWHPFAPDNDVIYFIALSAAVKTNVVISEGY